MKTMYSSLFFGLILCAGLSARGVASNELLTIGVQTEFDNLNPAITSEGVAKYMLYLAWRPLVILNHDNKWVPMMIKEIPSVENKLAKKKGATLVTTIELIDKAQWGDGTPLTCKDVEFGWKVGKSPNSSVADREMYDNISSITWDPAKPKKCTVIFAQAKYDFFYNYPYPLPAHLEEPIFAKFGDKPQGYERNSLYTTNPTNPGLYYGPYVVSDVKLGDHVTFTANPKFLGKTPAIKKIVFKLINQQGTMLANLRSGGVDMLVPPAGLAMDQAVEFEDTVKKEHLPFTVVFNDGLVYTHIEFNLDNPLFADVRVRKAIALSFDKNQIVNSLLSGKASVASAFVPSTDPWFSKKATVYNYDRRKAAALLDEAGWKVGESGTREKNGQRLAFTLEGIAGSKVIDLIEAYLQAQAKYLGIEMAIKNVPGRVFFGEVLKHRNFDAAMFAWISIPENVPRTILTSAAIPSEKNSFTGQNFPGYKSAEMDKLVDEIERELNATKRAVIGRKMIELYAKDVPCVPVYFRSVNAVVPKAMKGYQASAHMFYETLNVEDWSL